MNEKQNAANRRDRVSARAPDAHAPAATRPAADGQIAKAPTADERARSHGPSDSDQTRRQQAWTPRRTCWGMHTHTSVGSCSWSPRLSRFMDVRALRKSEHMRRTQIIPMPNRRSSAVKPARAGTPCEGVDGLAAMRPGLKSRSRDRLKIRAQEVRRTRIPNAVETNAVKTNAVGTQNAGQRCQIRRRQTNTAADTNGTTRTAANANDTTDGYAKPKTGSSKNATSGFDTQSCPSAAAT